MKKKFLFIDLFAGLGGVTTGLLQANVRGEQICKVVAAINHNPAAIDMHTRNHPYVKHYIEDVVNFDITKLLHLINRFSRDKYFICIWASIECIEFSKAKNGPKDEASRTLANALIPYLKILNPDYLFIENVEEFQDWGPLNKEGIRIKEKKGTHFLKWVDSIKKLGYEYNAKIMNSADYGAYTARKRFFCVFSKLECPVGFPRETHIVRWAYNPFAPSALYKKSPYNPVKEVLQFEFPTQSIFERKKPYVENTLKRIYDGLQKFVPEKNSFLQKYHGTGKNICSIEEPASTIPTKDRLALIQIESSKPSAFLVNPQYESKGSSVDNPCFTIISKINKRPPSVVQLKYATPRHRIKSTDSPYTKLIKKFMKEYGIQDIYMRMLNIPELVAIQGLPKDYILTGTEEIQKQCIGNVVIPIIPKLWMETIYARQ